MKLGGLMPVKNEDWILGLTARAALMWCDFLVILDHASTDYTAPTISALRAEFGDRVYPLRELDPVWHEMNHRQRMLDAARREGATHIVTIDADELLTGNLLTEIRPMIEGLGPGEILRLPWLATTMNWLEGWAWPGYYVEGPWAGPLLTMAFKDDPRFHWSAEVRDGYDFHRRHPLVKGGSESYITFNEPEWAWGEKGGILHLQFMDGFRLLSKQALYQMTEVIRWPGRKTPKELAEMYGAAVYGTIWSKFKKRLCDPEWLQPYQELLGYLKLQANVPFWQFEECQRLWAEHGPEKFAGLDLFGVVGK